MTPPDYDAEAATLLHATQMEIEQRGGLDSLMIRFSLALRRAHAAGVATGRAERRAQDAEAILAKIEEIGGCRPALCAELSEIAALIEETP